MTARPLHRDAPVRTEAVPADAPTKSTRAESLQRTGRRLILSGFVITCVGVALYCGVCFAGGVDADMGDVLLANTVPLARATLAVLGIGTLVWLAGSFAYLRGAMDADEVEPNR